MVIVVVMLSTGAKVAMYRPWYRASKAMTEVDSSAPARSRGDGGGWPQERHPRWGADLQALSLRFFSGRLRTGLPVAAAMAFITLGATTQMVGSPTPPQKS